MSNKETLQSYNTRLSENNNNLNEVLNIINELPEAGTGEVIDMYSTEETKTNKVWIDGKPIYRKVISSTNALKSGANYVSHNIASLGEVVDSKLVVKFPSNHYYIGGTYENATSFLAISYINNESVTIQVGSGWGSSFTHGFVIILEYTKTAD